MNALTGLMNPAAIGQNVQAAFQQGQQQRAQMETKNALSTLVQSPDDQDAMANLAKYNPQAAMQMEQRRQQAEQAQAEAQRSKQEQFMKTIPEMARLLEFGSQGPEQYAQAIAMAKQMGLPGIEQAPQQYDPEWVKSNLVITRALATGGPEVLSTVGKEAVDAGYQPGTPEFQQYVQQRLMAGDSKVVAYQPGGGAARIAPDGSVTPLIIPNPGTAPAGAPAGANIPSGAIEALKRGEGSPEQFDQMFGQGAAARIMGGAGSNASGGFQAN